MRPAALRHHQRPSASRGLARRRLNAVALLAGCATATVDSPTEHSDALAEHSDAVTEASDTPTPAPSETDVDTDLHPPAPPPTFSWLVTHDDLTPAEPAALAPDGHEPTVLGPQGGYHVNVAAVLPAGWGACLGLQDGEPAYIQARTFARLHPAGADEAVPLTTEDPLVPRVYVFTEAAQPLPGLVPYDRRTVLSLLSTGGETTPDALGLFDPTARLTVGLTAVDPCTEEPVTEWSPPFTTELAP
jgi:hypothetical protein